jgi:transposase InsO family protein
LLEHRAWVSAVVAAVVGLVPRTLLPWRAAAEVTCSKSRRSNCYAVMDACFSTVKNEVGERFIGHADAMAELFDHLEVFYNQRRRHSSAGRMSSAAFERRRTHAP